MSKFFSTSKIVVNMAQQLLEPKGFKLLGILGKTTEFIDYTFLDLHRAFKDNSESNVICLAQGDFPIQLGLMWFPPNIFDGLSPTLRLSLGFPDGSNYQFAEDLFLSAIQLTEPFWGELNQLSATTVSTFCDVNGHASCIPNLGTTNFFGREYCEFFGGETNFSNAGFQKVIIFEKGVVVSLGLDFTPDEFKQVQKRVQNNLGGENVFESNWIEGMPEFK